MVRRIIQGDAVKVISGGNKGVVGVVVSVLKPLRKGGEARLIVSGCSKDKRHTKPTPVKEGGIVSKDRPIPVSNVCLYDESSESHSRVGYKFDAGDNKKRRYFKKSGDFVD